MLVYLPSIDKRKTAFPSSLRETPWQNLLDVGVIIDVIAAIAIISLAAAAIPEFQLGVVSIGTAADSTLVPVRLLAVLATIAVCPLGIGRRGFPGRRIAAVVRAHAGQNVLNLSPEKQEVVEQGNHWEQAVGKRQCKETQDY